MINFDEYMTGLDEAVEKGLIHFGENIPLKRRLFSHIFFEDKKIKYYLGNSRNLSPILEMWVSKAENNSVALELGPGSGIACCQLKEKTRKENKEIRIETISHMPINPFIYFNFPIINDRKQFTERELEMLNILYQSKKKEDGFFELSEIDSIEGFITKKNFPFIDSQEIKNLDILPESKYDIIFDKFGALHYTIDKRNNLNPVETTIKALKSEGILYISNFRQKHIYPLNALDAVCLIDNSNFLTAPFLSESLLTLPLLITPEGSTLGDKIRKTCIPISEKRNENVYFPNRNNIEGYFKESIMNN